MSAPFPEAYWVEPGRLMAGAYPGEYDPAESRRRIDALLASGIRSFISLMEAREDSPEAHAEPSYVRVVQACADRAGVATTWRRFDIHDMSVPSTEQMDRIQAAIDEVIEVRGPAYVHCWRGRGRTGTVVGAYLIRRALATPENFVDVIRGLRGSPWAGDSPETAAQVDFVRSWARLRGHPIPA